MTIPYIIYLGLLLISFIISLFAAKKNIPVRTLSFLLFASLVTEFFVEAVCRPRHIDHHFIYHIYIPVEYSLTTYFFYQVTRHPLAKKIILYSIPVVSVAIYIISFSFLNLKEYPGITFNIEGFFIISWAIFTLLSLEVDDELPLYKTPLFWISSSLVLFYSGVFVLNITYDYISVHYPGAKGRLQLQFNTLFNILLYTFLSTGFIWTLKKK
jgi:hypothetical protein